MPKNLPLWIDYMPPEIAKKAEEELGETAEKKVQSLEDLRGLIRAEKDLRAPLDDAFLLRFLRVRKHDVKQAFNVLRNYYSFKKRYSRFVTEFKPSELMKMFEVNCIDLMPQRMENGSVLAVVRIGYFDLDSSSPDDYLAACLMAAELAIIPEVSQVCGGTAVIDFENFNLGMLRKCASPKVLFRFVSIIQNCFPFRVSGFHLINEPLYFNILFNALKRLLTDKMKKKIFFHGNNLDCLHKKVPPELLPEELGGKLGPLNNSALRQKLLQNAAYFEEINSYGYNKHNEHYALISSS